MRFEEKGSMEQIRTLKRLHKYLNREIFQNALSEDIVIDICNINKGERDEDFAACFRREHIAPDMKTRAITLKEAVLFGNEFIYDDIARMKTQKAQAFVLGAVMLHEMIHQYCYENGLDDTNHGGQWLETAERFQLLSAYEDGELLSEELTEQGEYIVSSFRMR